MRMIVTFSAALALAAFAWASDNPPVQSKAPVKKPAAPTSVAKTPAKAPVTASKTVARKPTTTARSARKTPAPRTTWRNRQAAPTPDRYREIQTALAARGYLSEDDANGAWGPASADALKKFQNDQTLESTGKINSLSLIALGLGPRHDSTLHQVTDGNLLPQLESGHN